MAGHGDSIGRYGTSVIAVWCVHSRWGRLGDNDGELAIAECLFEERLDRLGVSDGKDNLAGDASAQAFMATEQ
jgi:hypothetical protein